MAADSLDSFLGVMYSGGSQPSPITAIFDAHIADAAATSHTFAPSECILADISHCLLRNISFLSELSSGMAHGEHVDVYLSHRVRQMEGLDGFDDLQHLDQLNQKERFLKSISAHLRRLEEDIKQELIAHPFLSETFAEFKPQAARKSSMAGYSVNDSVTGGVGPTVAWMPTEPVGNASPAAEQNATFIPIIAEESNSENTVVAKIQSLLGSLSKRGKGRYYCPYEQRCQRGGVDSNGERIAFERNSDFRAHLYRHCRPYKCHQPNCTNTKGFARLDQLLNHQQVVHNKIT